jgi:hypothetical protein
MTAPLSEVACWCWVWLEGMRAMAHDERTYAPRRVQVGEQELAAWTEYPEHLSHRRFQLFFGNMVHRERGGHDVDGRARQVERLSRS